MSESLEIVTPDNVTLNPMEVETARLKVQKYYIPRDRIALEEKALGHGGFGVVKRAILQPPVPGTGSPITVVVKILKVDDYRVIPLRAAYRLFREMLVWATCQHENILQFIGYHLGEQYDPAYLISPYMKNGNIAEYLKNNQIDSGDRLRLIQDTLNGVEYLHTRDPAIVHGDLKAANVVVSDSQRAQLCDFGLSAAVHEEQTSFVTSTAFSGSIKWCSPETIEEAERTCPSDIWSWGCLVLEVMTGEIPYSKLKKDSKVTATVLRDKKTPEPDPVPDLPGGLLDLLRQCWTFESDKRPDVHSCRRTLDALISQANLSSIVAPEYRVYDNQLSPELLGTLEVPEEKVGAGGFGDVYRGKWMRPGEPPVIVAIKRVRYLWTNSEEQFQKVSERFRKIIKREIVVWVMVKHPNILPLMGYQMDSDGVPLLISPWCQNGNLSTYIETRPNLSRLQRIRLLHGAAAGLTYLHTLSPPIVHGGIKPQNIVIQDNLEAALCDFGSSRIVDATGVNSGLTTTASSYGTIRFLAPEVLEDVLATPASDVFSFGGVILFAMSDKAPFEGKRDAAVILAVVTGRTPERSDHPHFPETDRLWGLFEACYNVRPGARPSMPTLLSELEDEMQNS